MSNSGAELKCYEERCSYKETTIQCQELLTSSTDPLAVSSTFAYYVPVTCPYTYNTSSKSFVKGLCISNTLSKRGPITNSAGIMQTSCSNITNDTNLGTVTNTTSNGGAGGGSCNNGEVMGPEATCAWIYGDNYANNAGYQSCVLSYQMGIVNLNTSNCSVLQSYINHN